MKDFKELRVWSKAHDLTVSIYNLTRAFPRDEIYGLTSQVRRSAASIGANIAEGCGRMRKAFGWRNGALPSNRRGSASETEYHLLLAKDVGFLSEGDFRKTEQRVVEVQRMLTALVQKVQPVGRTSQSQG